MGGRKIQPGDKAGRKREGRKMKTMISKTGIGHGWGSDPYKWVSYLTPEERAHVRNGTAIVIITGCPPDCGNHGITFRQAVDRGKYGITHRVPAVDAVRGLLGSSLDGEVKKHYDLE